MGGGAGLTPEETRGRGVQAAAAVFAEQGFEGARVAEIARQAGLSVGAIYNHYGSKAELLSAVVERRSAEELGRLLATGLPAGVLDLIALQGAQLEDRNGVAPLL